MIISEFMKRSSLSKISCTDVYNILNDLKNNERVLAYNKIENILIPHLKEEGKCSNVGIAIGMLIDDRGLSQEEGVKMTKQVIKEILHNNKNK